MNQNEVPSNDLWQLASLPNVRPFEFTRRIDLLAGNVKQLSSDVYVIFEEETPAGQIRIVRNIAPFAEARVNVGTPQETFENITPEVGDGWFAFDPQVETQSAVVMNVDMNSPKNAGGTLNNNDRTLSAGTTFLAAQPRVEAWRYNPALSFVVESKKKLSVTFRLLSVSTASAIANPFQIGDTAGLITKRVDFAGVVVAGYSMPVSTFQLLQTRGKIQ